MLVRQLIIAVSGHSHLCLSPSHTRATLQPHHHHHHPHTQHSPTYQLESSPQGLDHAHVNPLSYISTSSPPPHLTPSLLPGSRHRPYPHPFTHPPSHASNHLLTVTHLLIHTASQPILLPNHPTNHHLPLNFTPLSPASPYPYHHSNLHPPPCLTQPHLHIHTRPHSHPQPLTP